MENNDRQIELKFQRFFTVNFPKVKNFAQMLLKSEADAEDVAQDVFCKLWLQPELWLDNDKELDNYIFIMTRNIVLNIFKHQQVEQEYQSEVIEKTLLYELTEKEFDQERDVKDVDIFPYLRKQIEDPQRLDGITSVLEKMLKYILTVETNIDLPIIEFQFKELNYEENQLSFRLQSKKKFK